MSGFCPVPHTKRDQVWLVVGAALGTAAAALAGYLSRPARASKPDKIHLTYFRGRGRAEMIRMALGATGIQWEEDYISERSHMTDLLDRSAPDQQAGGSSQPLLLYSQVPLLEVTQGEVQQRYVQSGACLRFVGRTYGLYGDDAAGQSQIDMLVDGAEDFLNAGIIAIPFSPDRSAALDKLKQAMKKYLGAFEDVLVTGQFLVNNKLSIADTSLFRCVHECVEHLGPAQRALKGYPTVQQWYALMLSSATTAALQAYLKSDKRTESPADPEVAAKYYKEVYVALGRECLPARK